MRSMFAVCCTAVGTFVPIGGQGADRSAEEATRWRIVDGNRRIEWNVAEDRRLPHGDSIEMSGRYASLIFSYNVSETGDLSLKRQLVWPMYRKAPNNTHGSFTYTFGEGKTPQLLMNGRPCGERPRTISLDGVWRCESVSTSQTLRIVRHVFPSVHANLCTSSLYYDALRHAAMLEREIGDAKRASEYEKEATRLEAAIESHFGCKVSGFETYRYYDGCKVLRSWIGIPLCMGIYRRAEGTTDALFSPALWTRKGMLCAEGDKKGVTWDRSLLYALRGVFAAGHGDRVMDKFLSYSRTRLVGEHVPYPVEEGRLRRHLSAESALFCRIVTEGMFGIEPTGLGTFKTNARLPKGVKRMSLKNIRAFGRVFDIVVDCDGTRIIDGRK